MLPPPVDHVYYCGCPVITILQWLLTSSSPAVTGLTLQHVWRQGVVLRKGSHTVLVEKQRVDGVLLVVVTGPGPLSAASLVEQKVADLLSEGFPGLSILSASFSCPSCVGEARAMPGVFDSAKLMQRLQEAGSQGKEPQPVTCSECEQRLEVRGLLSEHCFLTLPQPQPAAAGQVMIGGSSVIGPKAILPQASQQAAAAMHVDAGQFQMLLGLVQRLVSQHEELCDGNTRVLRSLGSARRQIEGVAGACLTAWI